MLINEQNRTRESGDLTRRVYPMYATRLMTEIYHLVQPGGKHTVCGLRISRITSDRKANTLQLVTDLSRNLTICKHCERIREQDLKE